MKRLIVIVVAAVAAAAAVTAIAIASSGSSTSSSATIKLRSTSLGKIVVDSKGHTLYLFEKDKRGKSACSGQCAKNWPPLIVRGKPKAGSGLSAARLGTTKRSDGRTQVTYGGHPLYTFIVDAGKPGSVKGEGIKAFGAEWYVVGANGKKVEKKSGTSTSSQTTKSMAPAPYGY
ncbi:MAG: COG4315 family predicted lipoprotein [Solirubrobacteraceae bacterium]